MKHLKAYENINGPKIGDYVIIKANPKYGSCSADYKNFLENNIGQISSAIDDNISVKYNSGQFPDTKYLHRFNVEEILYYSKNKEDLEVILAANKYNI